MKVAILTDLRSLHPGYSICGIALDQVAILKRYGHESTLFVNQNCVGGADIEICRTVPDVLDNPANDLLIHIASYLEKILLQFDLVMVHDWILTHHHRPYAEALKLIRDQTRNIPFLHWVHSIPTEDREWWTLKRYGMNHHIVYQNETDRMLVANQFQCAPERVKLIPPIKDLRTYWEFHEDTWKILDAFPGLYTADLIEVYPASADRLKPKGVEHLIRIFAELKKRHVSVCCLIADPWVTQIRARQDTGYFRRIAERLDLTEQEIIFSSELFPPCYEQGLPRRVLRELQLCSNLFIAPTIAESFGLGLPEASLSGGVFPVLNSSLQMHREVAGNHGLFLPFGSYTDMREPKDWGAFYAEAAKLVLARFWQESALQENRHFRQKQNLDYIWNRYYEPAITEAISLCK